MAVIPSCMKEYGWVSKGTELSCISSYCISGKHQIINDDFNLFTMSIIAILPILKGHIIPSCMDGSGLFSKGTELSLNRFGKHRIINENCIMYTRNCVRTTDKE